MSGPREPFDIARLVFMMSLMVGVFLGGGIFASKEWQPYQLFEDGYNAARQLYRESRQTRPDNLWKKRYDGDGVTLHDTARVFQGLTLIQGLFPEGAGLRLVDMAGNVVHSWSADFFAIWENPSHVIPEHNIPKGRLNYHTQGIWLFPEGSVVFNFGELGTAKLDKCGTVMWTVDRMTHHSITVNADGSFWIPTKADVREVPDALKFKNISLDGLMESGARYEDRLLLVNPDGKIEREISVLQALFDGKFERELFEARTNSHHDPTHVNDIEVVTPALAGKVDGVEAGDLLISMRQMHMLAIMDEVSGQIKWTHTGPWLRQHDADITDQGNIEVFNNGDSSLSLGRPPGSNIISLDPATGESSTIYPLAGQKEFFTKKMGMHQLLPNGNRLITESQVGRVFEVDERGRIVWEYIKPYDDSHSALIESAIRYEDSYFTIADWSCP